MKTILSLTSAIFLAVATTAIASSPKSDVLLDQQVSEKQSLHLSALTEARAEFAGTDAEFQQRPAVSGFELGMDSELGTLALLAGFVGMTFVMIRRRQAS